LTLLSYGLAISLTYPSREEEGILLVQMIFTCLRCTNRRGGSAPYDINQGAAGQRWEQMSSFQKSSSLEQVVAREDKGLLGKDWNKSPPTRFATSPSNPTVRPSSRAGVVLPALLPVTKQQEVHN
jgi:hypothetical protein